MDSGFGHVEAAPRPELSGMWSNQRGDNCGKLGQPLGFRTWKVERSNYLAIRYEVLWFMSPRRVEKGINN